MAQWVSSSCLLPTLLLLSLTRSPAAEMTYVQTGSNVTQCGMKCPKLLSQLLLSRRCGGKEEELLLLDCLTKYTKPLEPRLHLDTSSGCWTLPQAGRGDSCVYEVRDRGAGDKVLSSTSIRVLEMTYVQTGSNVTQCGMKCPKLLSQLLLSRRCGGKEEELLLLDCLTKYTKPLEPRLHLDTSSGCWTLPQAGRGDSCVYEVRDRGAGDKVLSSTSIRVLEMTYVQTGSNVTQCGMKCPKLLSQLLLSRRCGGKEEELLLLDCLTKYTKPLEPRLHLNTSSGCWTLPQAGRGDSCVYEVRDRGAGDKVLSSTSIRVLEMTYVQTGSNVTQCGMKCPKLLSQLLLSRRCGGKEEELLLLDCLTKYTKPLEPRLHLDTSSGCWTLPQAGRGDSCVYEVRDRGAGDKVLSSTSIRVLEMTYVQTGSNVTQCGMKCPKLLSQLLLSRRCGGKEEELLLLDCLTKYTKPLEPRLHLDTSSGCWTLPQAGRGDSCVYEVRDRGAADKVLSSTSIRVLDPVLIYNISSTSSRLGEDIAVTVQFSGEESHVTWELDGGRLPERYRLIDDNRTLIIPSVQRDDAERTFRVRVTNPVSEEVRNHRLEVRDPGSSTGKSHGAAIAALLLAVPLVGIICAVVYQTLCRERRRDVQGNRAAETDPLSALEEGVAPPTRNGSTHPPIRMNLSVPLRIDQCPPDSLDPPPYEDTEGTSEPRTSRRGRMEAVDGRNIVTSVTISPPPSS